MIVFVTGASGCLGSEFVRRLRDGHTVIGTDRTPFLSPPHPSVRFIHADLRDVSVPEGVDLLINCAGVVEASDEEILFTNLATPIRLCAEAVGRGTLKSVINVCSMNGINEKRLGKPAYSASKAGLIFYTKVMAVQHPQIQWQALCPGTVRGSTIHQDIIKMPQHRLIAAEDVVRASLENLGKSIVVTCGESI